MALSAGGMGLGPCLLYTPTDDSRCPKPRGFKGHHKSHAETAACFLAFVLTKALIPFVLVINHDISKIS